MTKLRSRSLVSQFRTLFAGGTLSGLGEGELLERFVGHRDEAAFAELVARHGPMVLAVCRRWLDDPHEVEDAFQATFLVLVRKAGGLRDRESVAQWLYGVSHRVARHARAAAVRRSEREMRAVARRREPDGPDPADELAGREILAMVHDELARLPEKQQAAAVLCLVQGLSHEAAARALGWPLGTLKTRVADARATLSRRLARRGVAPSGLAAAGGSALRLPVGSLPPDLAGRTVDAALSLIADPAMKAGVVGKSVAALVREVSRTMVLTRLSTVVAGLAVLAALALGAPVVLRERPGAPAPMEQPAAGHETAPAIAKANPVEEPRRDLYGDALPRGAVLRLGTIKYRQDSPIYRIAYTPDGKYFVTGGEDSILRVWDATAGRIVRRIDPDVGAMEDFSLTRRGNRIMACGLVLGSRGGLVRYVAMVELETGVVVDRANWKEDDLRSNLLALCADRPLIALCPRDGDIHIVDAWTGAETCRFDLGHRTIERIAFARDGKRVAVETDGGDPTSQDRHVVVFDLQQGKELRDIAQRGLGCDGLVFSPDGVTLAAAMDDHLFVWVVATGERIPFLHALVGRVCFSADGRTLAGIGRTGRFGRFDLPARRLDFTFDTKGSPPGEVALSPDGRTLIANDGPMVLHSWEIKSRRDRFATRDAHTDSVETILITSDGRTIITAGRDRTIRLWDLGSGRQVKRLNPQGLTQAAALMPHGQTLVASTLSNQGIGLNIWDLGGGPDPISVPSFPMTSHTWPCGLGFADEGKTILVISAKGGVHGWDIVNKRIKDVPQPQLSPPALRKEEFEALGTMVMKAVFLAGGRKLAADVALASVRMIDMATGMELFRTDGWELTILSPDERIMALTKPGGGGRLRVRHNPPTGMSISSESGLIKLVDSETGKELRRITVQGSKVWALAFAPDGKTLAATTGWDTGQIHFLDVASGQETRTIDCPPLQSPALAFTPDGSRLVSAMADGSVLVWEVKPSR